MKNGYKVVLIGLALLGVVFASCVTEEMSQPIEQHEDGGEGITQVKEQIEIVESGESIRDAFERLYGIQIGLVFKDTLRRIKGVCVLVTTIPTEEEYGLLKTQVIQKDTELQLSQNGIRVLTREEFGKQLGAFYRGDHKRMDTAILCVNVNPLIAEGESFAAVSVYLNVLQTDFLPRERNILYRGVVAWQSGRVWLCGLMRIKEIRESVKDVVDELIDDYIAANEKKNQVEKDTTTKPDQPPER